MFLFSSSDLVELSGVALLRLNYVNVAIAFLWVYDYLITISSEVTFLFYGQWGQTKMMYLVCRYVPFAFVTLDILLAIQPDLSQTLCQVYFTSNAYIGGVILLCAECIFVTRACALWGYRRSIVAFFVITTVLYLCLTILIVTSYTSRTSITTSSIPSVSCVNDGQSLIIMAAYCLLVLEELETLSLSLYKAVSSFRRCRHGNRLLLEILIHHNIFYFASGLCFSVTVILCNALMQESYADTMAKAHVLLHALLVTRMHRDLWETGRVVDLPQSLDIALTTLGIANTWTQ